MANIDPFVRHMLMADEIEPHPANPRKVNIRGLVQTVRVTEPVTWPAVIGQLCVLLYLTGGRGSGDGQIVAVHADTDQEMFGSQVVRITYPADPLEVVPVVFRMRRCVVRFPGLYWIEFRHTGRPLSELALDVR